MTGISNPKNDPKKQLRDGFHKLIDIDSMSPEDRAKAQELLAGIEQVVDAGEQGAELVKAVIEERINLHEEAIKRCEADVLKMHTELTEHVLWAKNFRKEVAEDFYNTLLALQGKVKVEQEWLDNVDAIRKEKV